MVLPPPLFQLQPTVNQYEWGKKGSSSQAARYAAATTELELSIDDNTPYAELWMGTHPSGPSKVIATGTTLEDALRENEALSGEAVARHYDGKLPFLLKVLSIDKALSIQAHPTKQLARQLHEKDPKNYKDDNHKPEMAIALTDFEGFCGFRPVGELAHFAKNVRALRELVGESAADEFVGAVEGKESSEEDGDVKSNRAALKALYTKLMHSKDADVERCARQLVDEARGRGSSFAGGQPLGGKPLGELVVRLDGQFPRDIGLFNTFFLNHVFLKPGEAMFLQALDAHAYLAGDIVECMASSDNVIRAGFTPKFKDVDVLCDNLTYAYAPAEKQKMSPQPWQRASSSSAGKSEDVESLLYDPPIEEFSVVRTVFKSKEASVEHHKPTKGPSILICSSGSVRFATTEAAAKDGGKGSEVCKEGQVFFLGADADLHIRSLSAGDGNETVVYRAFVELDDKATGGANL